MAGIYCGHLLEFPTVRIDSFGAPPPGTALPLVPVAGGGAVGCCSPPNAQLFLLSHTHADHLLGLHADWTGTIITSQDSKGMLLSLVPEREREWLYRNIRHGPRRRFAGLKPRVAASPVMVDRIVSPVAKTRTELTDMLWKTLPYGVPKEYIIAYDNGSPVYVTVTLLDANHCPGSAMFLITSPTIAVLHTGDVRADSRFIEYLKRHPALQQFLAPSSTYRHAKDGVGGGRRVLDRIYLDTAAMLGTGDMPDREPVLQEMVEIMARYPQDTIFFLNTWCFGWEQVIKEVARFFNDKVHVDSYKSDIYKSITTDPFLSRCTTQDHTATRFHACERFVKCPACRRFNEEGAAVYNLDKRIVHVNMVEVKMAEWDTRRGEFMRVLDRAAMGKGHWPYNIDIPIPRHSSLPELQALVKLFKPLNLTPNTVASYARGLDYYLLPDLFSECIAPGAYERIVIERTHYLGQKYGEWYVKGLDLMRETMGLGLVPDLEAVEREDHHYARQDYIQESEDVARQIQPPRPRSRKEISIDQVSRAGGLPSLAPDDIYPAARAIMGLDPEEDGQKKKAKLVMTDPEYETDHESCGMRSSPGPAQDDLEVKEEVGEDLFWGVKEEERTPKAVKVEAEPGLEIKERTPSPRLPIKKESPATPHGRVPIVKSDPLSPPSISTPQPSNAPPAGPSIMPELESARDTPKVVRVKEEPCERLSEPPFAPSRKRKKARRSLTAEEKEQIKRRLAEGGGEGLGRNIVKKQVE
ncbi:hypothetical protein L198_02805 [Cryptococcus wingfieldii CBS 7118]|uniref:DNA repair metallo-beta-lactamase domain-containing protein n=1 Tax=Cryptococcus wingfieldii CBS 7118 TaxID=1295528 RepID=A0A1E3JMJ5_9TREE|nr:hypothetical protein L198_02805 [Cryptococcus wingfieldii CBS 7118]ODO02074.1 hypothetical protein L198_02805 [Cryptococcus wingfieldii CBS 7118]